MPSARATVRAPPRWAARDPLCSTRRRCCWRARETRSRRPTLVGAHPVLVEAVELVFVAVCARIRIVERGELERDHVFFVIEVQALDALFGHSGDARRVELEELG